MLKVKCSRSAKLKDEPGEEGTAIVAEGGGNGKKQALGAIGRISWPWVESLAKIENGVSTFGCNFRTTSNIILI